ncbi:MAG: hypothetical protein NT075_31600 [Chloroflexi bacterium]|nr:hypothetical protein [Chloroflexota bacterium]
MFKTATIQAAQAAQTATKTAKPTPTPTSPGSPTITCGYPHAELHGLAEPEPF